jgi:hypothetical protein
MELVYNSLLGRFQGTSGLENVPITRKRQYFGMIESYIPTDLVSNRNIQKDISSGVGYF